MDRILIVDDDAINCELLELYLESFGYETETAMSGSEALKKIGPHIDLVMLDVAMPGMSGFEVTTRLRQHPEYCDIPIVIVTAFNSRDDRLVAVQMGANDFIGKPIDPTELQIRTASQLKFKHSVDAIKALATTDGLTGLPNYRSILAELEKQIGLGLRYGRHLSVLFVDVDDFKALNDTFGHRVGDAILAEFATLLCGCLREGDTAGRWGGEEFLVILPETDGESATATAERVRGAVSQHHFMAAMGKQITCSIGSASFPDAGCDQDSLVEAADQAMYAAKRAGRNRVWSASETPSQTFLRIADSSL